MLDSKVINTGGPLVFGLSSVKFCNMEMGPCGNTNPIKDVNFNFYFIADTIKTVSQAMRVNVQMERLDLTKLTHTYAVLYCGFRGVWHSNNLPDFNIIVFCPKS